MFGLGWDQIIIILLVGIFLLGPERIPTAVQWVGSTVRKVRTMAAGAQEQLRTEIGPELDELRRQIADLQSFKEIQELRDLKNLNPRKMISRNIFGDDFQGGMNGLVGLGPDGSPPSTTGSGVAGSSIDAHPQADPATSTTAGADQIENGVAAVGEAAVNGATVNGAAVNGAAVNGAPVNGTLNMNKDDPSPADRVSEPAGGGPTPFGAHHPPPFDLDAT